VGALRLGVLSVGSLATAIMLAAMCAYIAALPGKRRDTWYLLGYLVALALLLLSYAARYSLFTPAAVATGQVSNLIVFGVVSLIQFAYAFGDTERGREARIVLVLSLVVAACVWGVNFFLRSSPREYDFEAEYFTFEYGPHVSVFALAGYLWTLVVLVRRALKVPARYPRLRAALLRFAGLLLATVALALVYFLFQAGLIARAAYAAVFNTAALLIAFLIFVVYLDDAPLPTSFLAKLIGVPLAILLVVFGIAGTLVAAAHGRTLASLRLADARAAAVGAGSGAPPSVAWVARADGAAPPLYVAAGVDPGWPAAASSARAWRGPSGARCLRLEFADTRSYFFEEVVDAPSGRLRVGLRYGDYRDAMHRVTSLLAVLTVAAALALGLGLPMVSRRGLLRPLALLLDGVRQVDGGNYATSVPVAADDEIGHLARAFNGMVRSVQAAEGSFQALAEGASDAILVISPAGRILYCNRMAARVSGRGREDLLGLPFDTLIAPRDRERAAARFAARMAGDDAPGGTEIAVLGPLGREVTVEATAARTTWHDGQAGVVILRDVTERRAIEERLRRQAGQLARADKLASLGVLVASVAHEVGNPTQVVAHDAAFLGDGLPTLLALARDAGVDPTVRVAGLGFDAFGPAAAAAVGEIRESAGRIERMIRELKDFAREGAPGVPHPVDLNQVVTAVVDLSRHFVHGATDRFSVTLASGLPAVMGERTRLEQVVLNLLQNACYALPDKSSAVTVRTGSLGDEVIVEVADEGVGIAPEDLVRVTEPFFTTRRAQGGTGLGLVVSERIVREHRGRLAFASEVGRGTTATVFLPAAPAARDAPREPA
jgi:PAS domain S-box-containing protein